MEEVKIEKVRLRIGEDVIDLTLDQAKELKEVLGDLFPYGNDKTIPIPAPYPQPAPIPWREQTPWWEQPVITWCGDETVLEMVTR